MELNFIKGLFGRTARKQQKDLAEPLTLAEGVGGATTSDRDSILRSFWGDYRNPAAILQDIYPTKSASAANDFAGKYLQDQSLYDLLDEMGDKDPTILGTEKLVASQVLGFPVVIEPEDQDDEQQVEAARYIERSLQQMGGPFGFRQMLFNMILLSRRHGFSVTEIEWGANADGALMPVRFTNRHPGSFQFDARGTLWYRSSVGFKWSKAPARRFIQHTNGSTYGNPFGTSEIYPLRWFWFLKKDTIRALAEGVQYYGLPIMLLQHPESVSKEFIEDLKSKLQNLRVNTAFILPDTIQIKSEQRGMSTNGNTPHQQLIDLFDRYIVRYLTGSTLSTMENGSTGSLAQSLTHLQVAKDKLDPLARIVEDTINRDLIQPIHELNFGDAFPPPRFVLDTSDSADLSDMRESFRVASELGVESSKRQFRETFGIDAPVDVDDAIEPKPTPSPIGGLPFSEATKENSPFAIFVDKEEIDEAYRNWRDVTNMTVNDLERWKEHPASRRASLSRAPIIRQLHLLTTPKKDWTGREVTSARRVYSFVQRMRNGEQGEDISKRFPISKRDVSLLNWGHNPTGKTVAALIRELDKAANDSRMADHSDVIEFATGPTRREQYRRFMAILSGLAEEVSTASALDIRQAMLDAVERIETDVGIDGITAATAAQYFDMPDLVQQMERTAAGGRALAMLRVVEASGNRLEGLPVQVAPEDFPPEFRDALDWMQTREIMNRDELREVTVALSKLAPGGRDAREIERAFRQEVLALARVPEPEVAALWQQELQRIVESGDTRVALLDFKDRLGDAAGSPIATDAYVNTVFRTETANAVAAQKRRVEEDPAVAGVIIGKRFFNPADGASRDSHEEMNGVVVAIGSAADEASKPGPPWSYNCRCDYEYIFAGETLNETPDAELRARRIRRFDQ